MDGENLNLEDVSSSNSNAFEFEQTVVQGMYKHQDYADYAKRISNQQQGNQDDDQVSVYSRLTAFCPNHLCGCVNRWLMVFFSKICDDWVFLLVLSCIMAVLSYGMDLAIYKLQQIHIMLQSELQSDVILQYFAWVLFPVTLITFSAGFVHVVGPNAIGSGIPEMKTIMRGVVLEEYLTFTTLVSKMIGLTTVLGSGLPIGKEGPFVHIASIVATLLTKFASYFQMMSLNETRQTEMLAAACAVGVACNFAAPVGGVLFSIEVTATYFAVRNYWRGFFGAVVGALIFRLLGYFAEEDDTTITALYRTSFRVEFPYDPIEMLIFAFIGIFLGFGGALFVFFHRKVTFFIRQTSIQNVLSKCRFLYPMLVSFFISSITFPPGLGRFMAGDVTTKDSISMLFTNFTWTSPDLTPEQEQLVNHWRTDSINIFVSLSSYIVSQFILTSIAITLPVPTGVFVPTFVIGAAFGRLVGECMALWFPNGIRAGEHINIIYPGGYAIVGAAAMAGSVTHTISTSVIVFELTGQISHGLPVLIAVLLSNIVSQCLQPSIYDSIIQINKLPYLPDIGVAASALYNITVDQIMIRIENIKVINYSATYGELKEVIDSGYEDLPSELPIVESSESMVLIGAVHKQELREMVDNQTSEVRREEFIKNGKEWKAIGGQATDSVVQPRQSPVFGARGKALSQGEEILKSIENIEDGRKSIRRSISKPDIRPFQNIFNASQSEGFAATSGLETIRYKKRRRSHIDIPNMSEEEISRWKTLSLNQTVDWSEALLDEAPMQVVRRTPLTKTHSLFSLLGLRQIYVVDMGKLKGLITLKEVTAKLIPYSHRPLPVGLEVLCTRGNRGDDTVWIHIEQHESTLL